VRIFLPLLAKKEFSAIQCDAPVVITNTWQSTAGFALLSTWCSWLLVVIWLSTICLYREFVSDRTGTVKGCMPQSCSRKNPINVDRSSRRVPSASYINIFSQYARFLIDLRRNNRKRRRCTWNLGDGSNWTDNNRQQVMSDRCQPHVQCQASFV